MTRLLSAMKLDVMVQLRNHLYTIGITVGAMIAVALSQLVNPSQLLYVVPALMVIVVGGSTLLYVAGLIIFERDEGTINAIIVSPMRVSEYLWSKIITLTTLSTFEAVVMIGGAMLIMSYSEALIWPNLPLLLGGMIGMGAIYTLIGVIMIVRFDKITEFIMPMAAVAVILQLPFLHFLGLVEHPLFLLVPTSPPLVLMQGAYKQLLAWEWGYAIGYTLLLLIGLSLWANRAFKTHMIAKVG